ncbi:hypothetical protein COCHEDRAFT_1118249 [Bipolaris maydis C5]|uniref:SnoaL-like domain-containing protein n=2 Tax=Cochliobolus heterostrophus TaxID=5016 RepID=M2UCD6_COCH5|nr:hypothetical protein COCHEDRAFT_1118249 [Bipolaris maydis C5]KAJ6193101.1 hypothetical protein J3E72DRAFT_202837 [Bipolaris maydis]KAJ6204160.1 hypothetical protein PSV09DRAFT_1118249 [Bipolaris maydis]
MRPFALPPLCVLLAATLRSTAASPPIASQDGFFFGNPSLDCEFVSQPRIYSIFSSLETDVTNLINHIAPDVDFTVVGHQPLAGHYHDLKHFYVNALYRLNNCIRLKYPDEYRIELQYITGGCDQKWSVQEVLFSGRANNGENWSMVNVWITRWEHDKMVEIRTYVDAARVTELLHDNEVWSNSSTHSDHTTFLPGPRGMPQTSALESLLAKIGY